MSDFMSWLKSRCTHDNFWNLMFWLGMTIGWFVTFQFGKQYPTGAAISSWVTILGVPFIAVKASKLTFTKEEGFFDSKGISLKDRYPTAFGGVFFVSIGAMIVIGSIMDSHAKELSDDISAPLLFSIFFLFNTLYFIHKNCPIAILFNKHTWLSKIPNMPDRAYYVAPSHTFINSSSSLKSFTTQNPIIDSSYSGWSGNIHNSNHYKR
jgi:hypothetical protein